MQAGAARAQAGALAWLGAPLNGKFLTGGATGADPKRFPAPHKATLPRDPFNTSQGAMSAPAASARTGGRKGAVKPSVYDPDVFAVAGHKILGVDGFADAGISLSGDGAAAAVSSMSNSAGGVGGLTSYSLDETASHPPSVSSTPGKSGSRGKWNAEEDELLRDAVQKYGGRNWKRISEILVGRTDVQCLHRWQKVLRPGLIKGPWTQEEDDAVVDLVNKHGIKSWSFIARQLKGRLGKQCRER